MRHTYHSAKTRHSISLFILLALQTVLLLFNEIFRYATHWHRLSSFSKGMCIIFDLFKYSWWWILTRNFHLTFCFLIMNTHKRYAHIAVLKEESLWLYCSKEWRKRIDVAKVYYFPYYYNNNDYNWVIKTGNNHSLALHTHNTNVSR